MGKEARCAFEIKDKERVMEKILDNIVTYVVTIFHPKLVVYLATKQQETLETKEHAQKIITESQKKIKQYITKLKSYVEEE